MTHIRTKRVTHDFIAEERLFLLSQNIAHAKTVEEELQAQHLFEAYLKRCVDASLVVNKTSLPYTYTVTIRDT